MKEQALTRSRRKGGEGEFQAENERLKQLIGELTIANDALKEFAGRERKMVANIIRDQGASLRKALRLSACSRRIYYYRIRKRTIPPDPYILEKIREVESFEETALWDQAHGSHPCKGAG